MMPRSGDTLYVGEGASVQFRYRRILFRVIAVDPKPTYEGWVWLDGYELDSHGNAVERRSIFVQLAGLRAAGPIAILEPRNRRRPAIPRPRLSPDALPAAPAKAVRHR